ncbi:MAG: iron-sulfur cluster assembly scaffold protein [Pyrinomonadaceae bacterium]
MTFYPPNVQARFSLPQNNGACDSADASGRSASFECGSFVSFALKVDPVSKVVVSAKFLSNGCGYMIAAGDVLAETLCGKKPHELHGLDRDELLERVAVELGDFPANRFQCVEVCIQALRSAFADLRERQVEEFGGEKALICTCFGVLEETVEIHIRERSVKTVSEVTQVCNAGGGCGSCRMLIQEMIDTQNDAA